MFADLNRKPVSKLLCQLMQLGLGQLLSLNKKKLVNKQQNK